MGLLWQPGIKLETIEREIYLTALKFYQGNKSAVADSLGVSSRTVDNKVKKFIEDGILPKNSYSTPATEVEPKGKQNRGSGKNEKKGKSTKASKN